MEKQYEKLFFFKYFTFYFLKVFTNVSSHMKKNTLNSKKILNKKTKEIRIE